MSATAESIVRDYFSRLVEIRGTGAATKETSYYDALGTLLNEVGRLLDPHVLCNGQLRNQGKGHPDFGLYTRKQISKGEPKAGQLPERGVVEVKSLSDDSWQTAKGKQVSGYFERYRLVLVTNYRDFRLIGDGPGSRPVEREFFSLAPDEAAFWRAAAHPVKTAKERGAHFVEFLKRVLMSAAPLAKAEDIAWFLASYARDALAALEEKKESTLAPLRRALEDALGIKFAGPKGEHFFNSTFVQTLFYGVFSAWVVWAKDSSGSRFDWRLASYHVRVPMVQSLFDEMAKPRRLSVLGLDGILDRAGDALNRVDRTAFFKSFDSGQAVQHFYEPFLEHFDPGLRKDLGVWYTPPEIVRYMVARVDAVLRSELGIADGLADKNVYVLDPCCGTGAYVVEVLRKIEETLRAKGADALLGEDVKQAARERVFGFEILTAPFIIAHWRIGDLLSAAGAPLDAEKGERTAIYLTNALTGWEPPKGPKAALTLFPELEQERDQAEHVKRDVPILVVLGNPPYNAFAGTSPEEEQGLVEPYKEGLVKTWRIKKFNLDDLYVRFFRVAERRIAQTGRGVFAYISNHSYLGDPSFVVARTRLLSEFDSVWIDCMNGDSRETGKLTPDGKPDPSVFSTPFNRQGIRVGTAVGLFVRRADRSKKPVVRYRDFWGASKRQDLLDSLAIKAFDKQYQIADPQPFNKHSFRPVKVKNAYLDWPRISDLCASAPINGLMEKRGGALFSLDRSALQERMRAYLDRSLPWEEYRKLHHGLTSNAAGFSTEVVRKRAVENSKFEESKIRRYLLRPFDIRWCYYTDIPNLWNRARPELWTQFERGNRFVMCRPAGVAKPEGAPVFFTRCLGDNDALRGHAYYLPFRLHEIGEGILAGHVRANLSKECHKYLESLYLPNSDNKGGMSEVVWPHTLAIGYSPHYLAENADGIAIDWPRVPLPATRALLDRSVVLGRRLMVLLDVESEVPGTISGKIADHLRGLGLVSAADLRVTAGWGRADREGKVYPGRGKIEARDWTPAERAVLEAGFATIGLTAKRGFELLGRACDVYLNGATHWRAVPETVWDYFIGGYQVVKKWLSYREESVLGRALTKEEAREVTNMVRRLTAIVLMADELDANYRAVRDNAYSWPN